MPNKNVSLDRKTYDLIEQHAQENSMSFSGALKDMLNGHSDKQNDTLADVKNVEKSSKKTMPQDRDNEQPETDENERESRATGFFIVCPICDKDNREFVLTKSGQYVAECDGCNGIVELKPKHFLKIVNKLNGSPDEQETDEPEDTENDETESEDYHPEDLDSFEVKKDLFGIRYVEIDGHRKDIREDENGLYYIDSSQPENEDSKLFFKVLPSQYGKRVYFVEKTGKKIKVDD